MATTPVNWGKVFAPDMPILELVVRGSIMYLVVFALLRGVMRRSAGELAIFDLVFVLLVAIGAESAMIGDQQSIASGVVLIATLVGWNYLLNVLSYHVPLVERLITPPPLQVIRNGKLLRHNMRRQYLTDQELEGHLRTKGIADVARVKAAYIEGDGSISVIEFDR